MSKQPSSGLFGVLGLVALVVVAFVGSVGLGIAAGFLTQSTAPPPRIEIVKYYRAPATALRADTGRAPQH